MKQQHQLYACMFDAGLWLISNFFMVLLVAAALFLLRIVISPLHMILSIVFSSVLLYGLNRKNHKQTAIAIALALVTLIVCVILAGLVFDYSWDGNTYRKTLTFALERSYNPVYEVFDDAFQRICDFPPYQWETWYDSYPLGTESYAACIYSITGLIETGKCYNGIVFFAFIYLTIPIFINTGLVKPFFAWTAALLLAANPIVLPQIKTFYNDGSLGLLIMLLLILLLQLAFFGHTHFF